MKINSLSLPHPVLGVGDDVDGTYTAETQVELGREQIILKVKQNLSNRTLDRLIQEHKAAFNVEVHCQQTVYRRSFLSFVRDTTIMIPARSLLNKVNVYFYITAVQDIPDYQIDGANEDYKGYTFEISKGDILAYSDPIDFPAEKDWQAFMAVTSFMEIQEYSQDEGPLLFSLTQDKIVVQMAKADYKKYFSFKKAQYLYPIFHSSIVFPALIYTLTMMTKNVSEYESSKWFQNLKWRLDHEDGLRKYDIEQPDHIPKIAQEILKNPVTRSLAGMVNIQKNPNVED